ncbi:hypothetical protein PspLS_08152 [Pyricularia sp. CBS 133598]|nr:hypothetical protein PspLS_08152 [Pyricularia sp. CBS 133598]
MGFARSQRRSVPIDPAGSRGFEKLETGKRAHPHR